MIGWSLASQPIDCWLHRFRRHQPAIKTIIRGFNYRFLFSFWFIIAFFFISMFHDSNFLFFSQYEFHYLFDMTHSRYSWKFCKHALYSVQIGFFLKITKKNQNSHFWITKIPKKTSYKFTPLSSKNSSFFWQNNSFYSSRTFEKSQ